MKHIMLDLETLGTSSQAPIVQLAAIEFDPFTGETIKEFDQRIALGPYFTAFSPDIDCIEWWLQQSDSVRQKVFNPAGRLSLTEVISNFQIWLWGIDKDSKENIKAWSHATFDPPVLTNAFRIAGITLDLHRRCFVDIRTLDLLANQYEIDVPKREDFGDHHDALADCKYQAALVSLKLRAIGYKETTGEKPRAVGASPILEIPYGETEAKVLAIEATKPKVVRRDRK